MKYFIYIITSLLLISCDSQDADNQKTQQTNVPVAEHPSEWVKYEFSTEIKKRCEHKGNPHGNDEAAIQYANNGNYFAALEVFDYSYEPLADRPVFFDSSSFTIVPAIDYIVSEARKHQVVIINEAHHVPYHRFFTMLLLKKLSQHGYNYFGAETLNLWDSSLTKVNYPTLSSGFYSAESQYGNLIRTALKTGFHVFAYEPNGVTNGMQREIEQARNIEKILKKDPDAKIIIHCGYSHLLEGEVHVWGKAMAGRLTEYTGIDPLTIDQVELTEHFDKRFENPYYKKFDYPDFVVPIHNGKMLPVNFRLENGPSDIFVYHPRTRLKYNRPHWLFNYYSHEFINAKITISFPVLAKAYISTENEKDAVPVDVIEIHSKEDSTALALIPKTSYKIIVENEQKQTQTLFITVK